MATGGTYTLLVWLTEPAVVEVGAVGAVDLREGWYAYTGSALGPGGFARIDRHRQVDSGDRDVRHWHVDSLLGHPDTGLASAVRSDGVDAECAVARRIGITADPVPGFGATDCACNSHLTFDRARSTLEAAVRGAHGAVRS